VLLARAIWGVAFVGAALLGRSTIPEGTHFGLIWPAGGVAVLWLLLTRARPLSVDVAALGVLAFAVNYATGASPALATVLMVTNVVQAVAATETLRRLCPKLWGCGGNAPLNTPKQLLLMVLSFVEAATLATLIGYVGYGLVVGEMPLDEFLLWLGRNLCGLLVIVTLGMLSGHWWQSRHDPELPRPTGGEPGAGGRELILALLVTVGLYVVAFGYDGLPLAFPLLIATVWIGARFSALISIWHSTLASTVTILLTLLGYGPFATVETLAIGLMLAQFFVAMLVVSGLALTTGRDERRALTEELDAARVEAADQARLLQTIIGEMTDGVNVVDANGRFLLTNAVAAELMGLDPSRDPVVASAVGAKYLDGREIPPEDRPSYHVLKGETVRRREVISQAGDGPARILSVSGAPLPPDDDGLARAVMVFHDVTAEHEARRELAAFARVVAHDLNNPVTAIEGWAELAADQMGEHLDGPFAREFIARVQSSSGRMRRLINGLADHALSGQRELREEPLDLADLVADVVADRDAAGSVNCDGSAPIVGDPVLLRQLVDNLVGNALKYVAAGDTPRIDITLAIEDDHVILRVADNGIGLPPGEHELVFSEFHRAHGTAYDGSGLGLAIARRVATRHGGTVTAYDNPSGQGTTFEVRLPINA
jgi:PAS domain S-box-containing protein